LYFNIYISTPFYQYHNVPGYQSQLTDSAQFIVSEVEVLSIWCIEEYYSAYYQSPRQMTCMWEKLQQKPLCCNM